MCYPIFVGETMVDIRGFSISSSFINLQSLAERVSPRCDTDTGHVRPLSGNPFNRRDERTGRSVTPRPSHRCHRRMRTRRTPVDPDSGGGPRKSPGLSCVSGLWKRTHRTSSNLDTVLDSLDPTECWPHPLPSVSMSDSRYRPPVYPCSGTTTHGRSSLLLSFLSPS